MRKILLINPPLGLDQRYGSLSNAGGVEIPSGLCYLAAALRKEGMPVGIIDAQALRYDDNGILAQVALEKPGYVALSATTPQIRRASALAYKIKTMDPSIIIFIGGIHVSSLPVATLQENMSFDIGVVGEGEETLCEAIRSLEKKTDILSVKGLVVRDHSEVRLSGVRPRIKDLDALPLPAFDLLPELDKHYYLPIQHVYRLPAISLITSRGCPGQCTFCDRSIFGNHLSFHSAEYVVNMLKVLRKDYGIRHVMFQDDEFFLLKKRLVDFCRLLKEARLDISWAASVRVDSVNKENLKLAKDSGCWQLSFGIESANQRILDLYRKGISVDIIKRALQETRAAGILVKGFLLLGNPLETPETVQEMIDFIKSQPLDDVSITFFTPYPGTAIYNTVRAFGHFEDNYDKMTCFDIVFVPHGMTKGSLIAYQKKALREFYLRPAIVVSYMRRIRSLQQFRALVKSSCSVLNYVSVKNRTKSFLVIGDDFGLSKEINAGIIAGYKKGNIDGISFMANGEAFDDAVTLIKQNPGLDVGLHLTLVELKPVGNAEGVPSLMNKNGYFYPDYLQFLKAYISGRIDLKEIDLEIGAQFDKVQRQGIRITRVDSHQQLHLLPGILEIIIKHALKHNITRIRYPYTPLMLSVMQFPVHPGKFLCGIFLNGLCVFQRRLLRKNGLAHPEYYCNVSNTGVHFKKVVRKFQRVQKSGCWEFSFHPATSARELSRRYPRWRYQWEQEYNYLMHPDFQRQFQGPDIKRNDLNDYAEDHY